jgi:hypothetical protein
MSVEPNDISKKLSDEIILYHKNSDILYEGGFGSTEHGKMIIDKTKKDSYEVKFPRDGDLCYSFMDHLKMCVDAYLTKFPSANNTAEWAITDIINIQQYKPGGGFHMWHAERASSIYPQVTRHLVFMMYLNDVTDGGETEFLNQNLKVKAEKGKMLIWPTDWTHMHRGITSNTQEKYIVTGWFNFL